MSAERGRRLAAAVAVGAALTLVPTGCGPIGSPAVCESAGSGFAKADCQDDARKAERGSVVQVFPECRKITFQVVPDTKNGGNDILFTADVTGFLTNPRVEGDIYRGVVSSGPGREPYNTSGISTPPTDDNGVTNVTMAVNFDWETANGQTAPAQITCPPWLDVYRLGS